MRQHYPTVGSHDRLTVTLFLAALFHMILILGISFSPPVADTGDVPTLEVLLVNNPLPDAAWNEEANYLAERTQQGSGNSPDGRTRQPSAGEGPESIMGDSVGGTAQPAPEGRPGGDGELLTGRGGARHFVATNAETDAATPLLPRETIAGSAYPFAGSDDAEELQLKGAPRRELVVTPNTRVSDVAVYLDAWKRRIEQVGTVNFPNAARRSRLTGSPVIEVVLASGGGLVRADVLRSSGHGELDRAAMDILKLATPFEPFPAALAARHDVLRFAYEWQFVGGRLAGSAVEVSVNE
ncbi:MAG TPA: TonB family protein [Steroidobacteraceae bacterium]|nr:TonB family protein [Steroidobacteraceae bacterium]